MEGFRVYQLQPPIKLDKIVCGGKLTKMGMYPQDQIVFLFKKQQVIQIQDFIQIICKWT